MFTIRTNENIPLIFEISKPGRIGYSLPELEVPEENIEDLIPAEYMRTEEVNFLKYRN